VKWIVISAGVSPASISSRTRARRGDLLGHAVADALGTDLRGQDRPRLRERLDRRDIEPERKQRLRQLAGAGGEVEHASAGLEAQLRRHRTNHRRRVLGAAALIRSGDIGEAACERVQRHA
jgi:hypothetical protein